jgi:diguanylate cyclase (GGDEF)-like protein
MSLHPKRLMTIMLIDEPVSRRSLASVLLDEAVKRRRQLLGEPSGEAMLYRLIELSPSSQIMSIFEAQHPDLILVTATEEADGALSLCRQIRQKEEERRTAFIVIDKGIKDGVVAELLELGANDIVKYDAPGRELIARINTGLLYKGITDELRAANHRLEILSLTDDLTGLANMRSFKGYYDSYLQKCRMGISGLAVLMMDLDDFKKINDCANHLIGSHIIAEVGKLIKYSRVFGEEFCPARYGGDEYIIACPTSDPEGFANSANALRKLIEEAVFTKDGHSISVTASIGICWVPRLFSGSDDDPIKIADYMLYESKRSGRNRVSAKHLSSAENLHEISEIINLGSYSQARHSVILSTIKITRG